MSEYYTQYLIPVLPEFRPEPGAVAEFAQGIISNGNVPSPSRVAFLPVTKEEGRVRPIRNAVTGETVHMRAPSRRCEQEEKLSAASQIAEHAANQREYDVVITGQGFIAVSPCAVGYVENDIWKPTVEAYKLEVRCQVRGDVVRLYYLESEEDVDKPMDMDFTNYRPWFGEDCSVDEREGIFVHPEIGAFRIPNAGCGKFWISFNFGKFLFPLLKDKTVNVLDDSVVSLARKVFGCDFVQACYWR
jgi:hypothetical protein